MRRTTVAALLLCLGCAAAHAEHAGPYLGFKGGGYSVDNLETRDNIETDFGDYAWGGYAGYRFSLPLAVEIEYLVLEEDNVLFGIDFEGNLFAASVKPTWDVSKHWELFAKLGWAWVDGDLQNSWSTSGITDTSVSRDDFLMGIGSAWHWGQVHLRLEYQFSEIETDYFDTADTELLTLGLAYTFN